MRLVVLTVLLLALQQLPWASASHQQPAQASRHPPGGLSPSDTPQLITFSHDDGTNRQSARLVLKVADGRTNPNGCKLPVTWFTCNEPCESDCATIKSLYDRGHEIAVHTLSHPDLRPLSKHRIRQEIVGSRRRLAECGVPERDINGFRAPFLSDKPAVREVLHEAGFRQVPLVADSNNNLMDYCTNQATGKPLRDCSPYHQLKRMFNESYRSRRSPITVAVHSTSTGYLANSTFRSAIARFMDYALAKGDVWFVTKQQLLDWMENPVPASRMAAFMSKYKCP